MCSWCWLLVYSCCVFVVVDKVVWFVLSGDGKHVKVSVVRCETDCGHERCCVIMVFDEGKFVVHRLGDAFAHLCHWPLVGSS
jgi:hypothetical protein